MKLKILTKMNATIHPKVCEKHLLYVAGCTVSRVIMKAGARGWQSASSQLAGPLSSGGPWYAPRMKTFSLVIGNQNGAVEIYKIMLTGPGCESLLANSDFSKEQHWFFRSERDNIEWYAKNIFVNVPFDQGYLRLALFMLLTASGLWRLNFGKARQHELLP